MKFTNGFWGIRRNVTAHFPAEVYDLKASNKELAIFTPVRPASHRGATLNCPMLSISFSSPMENIIRVRIVHHKGTLIRSPGFSIASTNPSVKIKDSKDFASFQSNELMARINKKDGWMVEFLGGGQVLTNTGFRNIGYLAIQSDRGMPGDEYHPEYYAERYMKEELALGVGEYIYGLGERFTPFVKNGQVVDMWNEDGGTASEQTYKNIPFYLSSFGYGVLVNHPEKVSFEVGSEKVSRVGFSVPGESLEYFIIYGTEPKKVLERYTALTGRPALPPAWSFGLWLTTSFTTDYDEKTVTGFIRGMADRGLPLHVFHFDCFWMKGFHWCDFQWDPDVFPEPGAMLKRLKERGLRICVWINPYIAQRSHLFEEGMEKGYLLKRPNGDVWQCDLWQAGMGIVDFTNPGACKWFADKLRTLVDMGVDCFKTDFGERIPTDVMYHDGSDPVKMHNYYTLLYNRTVFRALEEKLGKGKAVLFARSATAGSQQFPVHWGGDCSATYESMAETLRGGLSLCLSGFGFWSHDIGGFESTAPPDVYKRWIAFGLLSSHSRLHGSSSYRVPWLYDEESVDVLRHFTRLKCRLMPYLFGKALEAHNKGIPVMRAMVLEFPDDPACELLDRQYMLGDALLIAPVFRKDGKVKYYLPEKQWTDFITGKVKKGGEWLDETHGFSSVPLLARPDTVVPVGSVDNRPDYDFGSNVVLHIFQLSGDCRITTEVPSINGTIDRIFKTSRQGNKITIKCNKPGKPWKILLRGINTIKSAKEGKASKNHLGTMVEADKKSQTITVRI